MVRSSLIKRRLYYAHKEKARSFVKERVDYFCDAYGFSYSRIAVKNHRSRWGSCSRKRNLNFNYKLIFLPSEVADYVIVHELCHLEVPNHSQKFWGLVGLILPDYRKLRKDLRAYASRI